MGAGRLRRVKALTAIAIPRRRALVALALAIAAAALFGEAAIVDSALPHSWKSGGLWGNVDASGPVRGKKWGLIDFKGEWIVQPAWDDVKHPAGKSVLVKSGGSWFLANLAGRRVGGAAFKDACSFSEGLALAWTGGLFGYIDDRGSWAINPSLDGGWDFSGGLWPFRSGKPWGFLDSSGAVKIAARFEKSSDFKSGLAREKEASSGLWGYIDASRKWAIKPAYASADDFYGALARVQPLRLDLDPSLPH